jgi:hypothetical protein
MIRFQFFVMEIRVYFPGYINTSPHLAIPSLFHLQYHSVIVLTLHVGFRWCRRVVPVRASLVIVPMTDRNSNSLTSKCFTEGRGFYHPREFFRTKHFERFRHDGSQNLGSASIKRHPRSSSISTLGLSKQCQLYFETSAYRPRLRKLNFNRNVPSVLTDKSCVMNHIPHSLVSSCKRKAEAVRLPMRFLVKSPGVWPDCPGNSSGWP